jgi:Cu/Ag efflux protein CusF
MLRNARIAFAAIACLVASVAQAQAPTAPAVKGALAGNVVTITATIESVDQATRMVTLRGSDGRVVSMKASDKVKNLAQVKPGDQLVIKHAEAVALTLRKGSTGRSETVTTVPPQTAPLGAKPAMATAEQTTIVANVQSVDAAKRVVVLEGPQGRYLPLKVKDAAQLKGIKAGDSVEATFVEAVVIEVVGPKK